MPASVEFSIKLVVCLSERDLGRRLGIGVLRTSEKAAAVVVRKAASA